MPAANVTPLASMKNSRVTGESDGQAPQRRRLSDWIHPNGRKIKLDRRAENRDRRANESSEYRGPARRETIDQRENLNDRRRHS